MPDLELFKPAHYSAYLVRLWQESSQTLWRASAQCASTGEKRYFASLEALFAFLRAQTIPGQNDGGETHDSPHDNALHEQTF